MSTDTHAPTTRTRIARAASMGAVAGVIASLMMAAYTMIAAAIFDSGDQITNMAELVGYGTFLIEHLIFGLFLGLILFMGAKRAR